MGSNIPFTASAQKSIFFTPTMIPSLALWFDASDQTTITQSSGTVSEWRDKSSNAYSVIQGTASNRPTYATNLLNGLPGVQLSATSYLYQVGSSMPNFSSSPATTVYMVAKNGSTMPNWNIINTMWFTGISGGTQRYHFSFGYLTTNGITLFAKGAAVVNPSAYVVPLNSNAIIGFSSSATSNFIFYNGSNTAYASSGALPSANNSTWFLFGDARLSTPPVTDENIYEYVGFNTVLTTAQQQAVEGYLATKWGLQSSLSNGHPYKTTPLPAAPSLIYPPVYPTSAVSNPEFDPRIFSGCILWLDGADPNGTGIRPANGTSLTTWQDKSLSNFPFTSVGSAYNTTAVNGLPGISLSTNFFGYDPGSAQNNWQEVFAVGLWTGGSTFNDFNGLVTSCINSDGGIGGGVIFIGDQGTSNWYAVGNTYTTPVLNGTQTYTALPTIQSPFVVRTLSATAVNLRGLRFGIDRSFPTRIWQGFISEVICYNTALSSTQRQQVEAYLADKWKVSALSTQNIYAPGSYLTFVNALRIPALPMRRAVQGNKFIPPQYSNCVLWLDATDVNGTGTNPATGTITSWTDKSGSGNSSTASGGTPTLTANSLNGKPGVAFSGTSYIQVPRVVTSDWSIFIVFSTTQTGPNCTPTPGPGQAHTDSLNNHWWGGQGIFDGEMGGSVNDMGISLCGSPTAYLGYGTGNLAANTDTTEFSATAVNTGAGFIGEFFRTQSSGNLQMFVNGAFQVSTTGGTANRVSPNLKIGAIQTLPAGYYFTGNVYEIVCYTRVLNDIERQQIEGYFAWKWGLKASITSSHPFFLIPPVPLP
jgi:hypothetical protein